MQEEKTTPEEIEVTFKIKVDDDLVDMILNHPDVFMTSYSGYWARGIKCGTGASHPRGWLVYEQEDGEEPDKETEDRAIRMWDLGNNAPPLMPPRFYVLDKKAVLDVIREGVKRYGPEFQQEYDSISLDWAIQMVLLKECRYG
jgi:hypothetical protein